MEKEAQLHPAPQARATKFPLLRDLPAWIENHLRNDLGIPALAAWALMSERNFQRIFTREFGQSPSHYVERIRVQTVCQKIENTRMNLKEIAAACGFSSADVMTRAFKRSKHLTPMEYRARHRAARNGQDTTGSKQAERKRTFH